MRELQEIWDEYVVHIKEKNKFINEENLKTYKEWTKPVVIKFLWWKYLSYPQYSIHSMQPYFPKLIEPTLERMLEWNRTLKKK